MPESAPNQQGEICTQAVQERQQLAQAVHRRDGRLGIRHAHMHVQSALGVRLMSPASGSDALVALRLDQLDVEEPGAGVRPAASSVAPAALRRREPSASWPMASPPIRTARAHLELREVRLVVDPLARQSSARSTWSATWASSSVSASTSSSSSSSPTENGSLVPKRCGGGPPLAQAAPPSAARAAILPNTSAAASPLA